MTVVSGSSGTVATGVDCAGEEVEPTSCWPILDGVSLLLTGLVGLITIFSDGSLGLFRLCGGVATVLPGPPITSGSCGW